jgi:hypothetical protein
VSTTPIYQAALDRGLSIIPIPPREKGCKMPLWQELAAPDASLMNGCEGYNYGVVANDTFCILDIDDPEAFRNELGLKLPTTYTVATSRGKHLYFRHTDKSRRLGNRSGAGVFDFQANAKYVVGEGSIHPSGHVYSCVDSSPISEIPDSLVSALDRFVVQRKRERARLGLKAGDRQDMLNYAGSIYTEEITEDEMLEKLIERNETHSEEPLSLGDLQRMVQSAFKSWEPFKPSPEVKVSSGEPVNPDDWSGLFHSYEEVVNTPDLSYAIYGWCLENEIIMYGGLPGHGKTLLGLSTAKALLTGEPLFGYEYFKVERSKRVLYLCPEVGLRALRHRLKAFRLLPFVKSGQLLIRSLSAPEVPLMDPRILRAAEGADVFLDTAVRFMEGEENSSSEQRVFAKNLFTLLRTGARTVTGLHHSPKFAKGAGEMNLENTLRGTNELGAMISTAWGTKLVDQETTRLYIQNLKPRDFDPVGAFTLEGRPNIDDGGDFKMVDKPGTADLKDHQPTKGLIDPSAGREITRLLALGNSVREIADQVRLSKSVVGRFVRERKAVPA